jgi:hypothetical protein
MQCGRGTTHADTHLVRSARSKTATAVNPVDNTNPTTTTGGDALPSSATAEMYASVASPPSSGAAATAKCAAVSSTSRAHDSVGRSNRYTSTVAFTANAAISLRVADMTSWLVLLNASTSSVPTFASRLSKLAVADEKLVCPYASRPLCWSHENPMRGIVVSRLNT